MTHARLRLEQYDLIKFFHYLNHHFVLEIKHFKGNEGPFRHLFPFMDQNYLKSVDQIQKTVHRQLINVKFGEMRCDASVSKKQRNYD